MEVAVLYFEGCPNHRPVVEMVRRLVAEHGLDADVREIEVSPEDVERRRFLGSPTVQVDGVDIEPAARARTDYAMSCRVYHTPGGLPSCEMLLAALGIAGGPETRAGAEASGAAAACCAAGRPDAIRGAVPARREAEGFVASGGSVLAAALSSACCWLPLVALAVGASTAGISALFEDWRPVFIAVAVVMLGLGFHSACVRDAVRAGGCCARGKTGRPRLQRIMLWVSTIFVGAFVFVPEYAGWLTDGAGPAAIESGEPTDVETREHLFDVEGMHCEGCAVALRTELARLPGVVEVHVYYGSRTARVRSASADIAPRVAGAASRMGYTATARSDG